MKYQIMFYGGLVMTIVTLILAVVSFFKLNAGEALCDLVGINFKIKKGTRIKAVKKEKKKINIESKRVDKPKNVEPRVVVEHKPIMVNEEGTTLLEEDNTTLLDEENTTLLDDESTTLIDSEETTIISEELDETTLLENDNGFSDSFIKEIDIVLINSNDII